MASIQHSGVIQLIIVRRLRDRYQLVAGERRYRAAKLANQKTIPVICRSAGDREAVELSAIENLTHKGLNAIEKGKLLQRLCGPLKVGGLGASVEETAKLFKKTRTWATNLMRLLELPAEWRDALAAGEISERMGRALLPYVDQPAILAAVKEDMVTNPYHYLTAENQERSVEVVVAGITKPTKPAADKPTPAAVPQVRREPSVRLCSVIAKLKDLEALDRLEQAIDTRRKELTAAKGKTK